MAHSKDITEKILEDHNDVFADTVNVLLFGGQEVLQPDELENAMPVSQFRLSDGLHEQERDVVKRWRHGKIVVAAFGFENETAFDPDIPLRIISYDGAVYKEQVNRRISARRQGQKPAPAYPAITLVLYFGLKHWRGPGNLKNCFPNLPEELKPLVPDYPLHIIEIAFLTPEQIGKLKSDFRHVADYLVQIRTTGRYIPTDLRIDHVDETLKLLGAITGDDRFLEAMNDAALAGKEQVTMSNVIDSYIAKGRKEGCEETSKKYEAVLAEKDRAMAEKDRAMAEKDRAINNMAQELRELKLRYGLA